MIERDEARIEQLRLAIRSIDVAIEKNLFSAGIVGDEEVCDVPRIKWMADYAEKHLIKTFPNAIVNVEVDWVDYLSFHGNQWAIASGVPYPDMEESEEIDDAIRQIMEDAERFAERA